MRRLSACFIALAAGCSAKHAKPPPHRATPVAQLMPAPLYAKLFVQGATFSYVVQSNNSHWDDQDPKADARGNVEQRAQATTTCTVEEVKHVAGALAADLYCKPADDVDTTVSRLDGVYVATPDGLWRLDETPDAAAIAALTRDTMLIGATPSERTSKTPPSDNGSIETTVTRGGDTWCFDQFWVAGDEGGMSFCFARGALVSGHSYSSGASSHEFTFQLTEGT